MFNQKEHISRVRLESASMKHVPVWFMRQAGRYLPEYQTAMSGIKDFFEACYNPELVVELTLQPIQRFDFDAAIIFSDIMVLLDCMGFDIEFTRGYGPVLRESLYTSRSSEEIIERLGPIFRSIRLVREALAPHKALIGFAATPWTLLTYIYGKDRNFSVLRKAYLTKDPFLLQLLDDLTYVTALYLIKQIEHGADVIQLFDSHAYVLPHDLFFALIVAPTRRIVDTVRAVYPSVQIIGFPKGIGVMYHEYGYRTEVSITGVDYSVPVTWIRDNIKMPVQGNLDPFLLAYDIDLALTHSSLILEHLADRGLIFNLGHGILPDTPLDNVKRVLDVVRSYSITN